MPRYNDFKNDALSRCDCSPPYSAENAISSRCDLNPANGTYPFAALGHRAHGGTDVKVSFFPKLRIEIGLVKASFRISLAAEHDSGIFSQLDKSLARISGSAFAYTFPNFHTESSRSLMPR